MLAGQHPLPRRRCGSPTSSRCGRRSSSPAPTRSTSPSSAAASRSTRPRRPPTTGSLTVPWTLADETEATLGLDLRTLPFGSYVYLERGVRLRRRQPRIRPARAGCASTPSRGAARRTWPAWSWPTGWPSWPTGSWAPWTPAGMTAVGGDRLPRRRRCSPASPRRSRRPRRRSPTWSASPMRERRADAIADLAAIGRRPRLLRPGRRLRPVAPRRRSGDARLDDRRRRRRRLRRRRRIPRPDRHLLAS